MSVEEPTPPPLKRAKHFHADQSVADANADANAEAAEIDRSYRVAASSKILLRMAAKKGVKGRVSDISGAGFVVDRSDGPDETRLREMAKYGETINLEDTQCANCHHNDQLEQSMKTMDNRMSKVEGEIAELRADFRGLRELLLERLPAPPPATQPIASSSRPPPTRNRAPEGALPPVTRKRRREDEQEPLRELGKEKEAGKVKEKETEKRAADRNRRRIDKERSARRAEEEKAKQAPQAPQAKTGESPKQTPKPSSKSRKKSRPSQGTTSVPVFNLNQVPRFDKFSLSEQIIALARPNTTPETPDAPPLKLTIDKIPYAMFLTISESLPEHSRTSLGDLRVLWSGNSIARRVGEWLPVKIPYLHAAMRYSLIGSPTTPRVAHRNFVINDPMWPEQVQVPRLTSSIMAASIGLVKDPMAHTGAFVRDACTICDQQNPDTPQTWRRWLDKGTYDTTTLPNSYSTAMETMCGIPFATFLRDIKSGDIKRKR